MLKFLYILESVFLYHQGKSALAVILVATSEFLSSFLLTNMLEIIITFRQMRRLMKITISNEINNQRVVGSKAFLDKCS